MPYAETGASLGGAKAVDEVMTGTQAGLLGRLRENAPAMPGQGLVHRVATVSVRCGKAGQADAGDAAIRDTIGYMQVNSMKSFVRERLD